MCLFWVYFIIHFYYDPRILLLCNDPRIISVIITMGRKILVNFFYGNTLSLLLLILLRVGKSFDNIFLFVSPSPFLIIINKGRKMPITQLFTFNTYVISVRPFGQRLRYASALSPLFVWTPFVSHVFLFLLFCENNYYFVIRV